MRNVVAALSLLLIIGTSALAQEAPEEALSGRLQPTQVTELKIDLDAYNGELRLKSLLAPGTKVKKGEVVAEIEAPEYEDALDRAAENVKLSEYSVQSLEESLAYATESYKQQLLRTQRNADRAAQDYDYFMSHQRAENIRNSEMGLENYENNIADQEEELAQLTELYKGNDLAKESQDIVLNRSKRRLKTTKERFEMAKKDHARLLEVGLKRREEDLMLAKQAAALELARVQGDSQKNNTDLEGKLIRTRRGLADARKALKDLQGDAGKLQLVAPHDGLVANGGWNGNDGAQTPLTVGDKVNRGQVLATVVDQTKLTLSVSVKLEGREKFAPGTAVVVGEAKLPGTVKTIGFVVGKGNMVTANIEVENAEGKLLPGQKVDVALQ